ncbi:MAG: universal stress protein [Planctomycetaceae bacterium]|jgi:nucleotide-binding universal stress UspA family protein|nr:universal stress protein [Planctomycetaceae bacterium]
MNLLSGKPVIVPWDFSDMSQEALSKALGLAKDPDLIHVVHVTQLPPVMEPGVVWGSLDEGSIIKHCEDSFQTVLASRTEWTGVHFKVLVGDPGLSITDYAKDHGAELIVISSHGHTGLSRLLLGSVAERVVRLAHCPVLVLRK